MSEEILRPCAVSAIWVILTLAGPQYMTQIDYFCSFLLLFCNRSCIILGAGCPARSEPVLLA